MPPPRPASGDTIYVMYAYGQVTITVCPCRPASTTNQSVLMTLTFDLFDLESGVRDTCDVGYLCANVSLRRPLCSRARPDVRNRETDVRQTSDVRQKHRLMPNAPYQGRGIISLRWPPMAAYRLFGSDTADWGTGMASSLKNYASAIPRRSSSAIFSETG